MANLSPYPVRDDVLDAIQRRKIGTSWRLWLDQLQRTIAGLTSSVSTLTLPLSATVATTTLRTEKPLTAGLYRVSVSMRGTGTVDPTSLVTLTIGWTDDLGVAQTQALLAIGFADSGGLVLKQASMLVRVQAGSGVTFAATVVGPATYIVITEIVLEQIP